VSADAARPDRTHALVVGVERYDAGASWDLDGPAADAGRFLAWLLERGVPANQLLVFVSPLDDAATSALPPGIRVLPARREHVYEALTRTLPGRRGDLLWLFWTGHGVATRDEHLRLFYADANTDDKRNLDLQSLLTMLRSDLYAGFPRQVGVVDACQTYAERLQLARTLPTEELPYGQPLPSREQFVLFAASPGQVAMNRGSARTGLLSQELMEELRAPAGHGWPPDMDAILMRLDQRFTALRAAGRAAQTPTSFQWRPWTGGLRVLGDSASKPPEVATRPVWRPGNATLRELINRLLDLDAMADPVGRAAVVRGLRKGIATSIRYDPASRPHVVNIVTRCLEWPGGLSDLLEAIKLYADPYDPALAEAEAAVRRLVEEVGKEAG
jgi:Effector-associated domain 2/Caspase domain